MGRKRRSSPPPPQQGGDDFEILKAGPPEYLNPPPVVKARGRLIPVGNWEVVPLSPTPPHPDQ